MSNDSTGLDAYLDQQFAAARGEVASDPDPEAEQVASEEIEDEVAPTPESADTALSSDDEAPDGETDAEASPEPEVLDDATDAIRTELETLRAEKAERDRKELEALQQQQREEAARQQQAQLAALDREFAAFDEYDDGLGQKAKMLTARVGNELATAFQGQIVQLRQEADSAGRSFAALYQVLQAEEPEVLERVTPLAKAVMRLNSPEEQSQYVQMIRDAKASATAEKDQKIAKLEKQLKTLIRQQEARGLAESGVLAAGSSSGVSPVNAAPAAEPQGFDDWFSQQYAQAQAAARGR